MNDETMPQRIVASFTVEGEPVGKGRPRYANRGGRACTYTPEKTARYEQTVRAEYKRACGNIFFERGTPLFIVIHAYYAIPKRATKQDREDMLARRKLPTKIPDYDNISKIISDSCNGVAYADDSQIVSAHVYKTYAERPRVEVKIGQATLLG